MEQNNSIYNKDTLLSAINSRHAESVKICVERMYEGDQPILITALHEAAKWNDDHSTEIIEILLLYDYRVNQLNEIAEIPLHIACRTLSYRSVETLLANGSFLKVKSVHGRFPLEEVSLRCLYAKKYVKRYLHWPLLMDSDNPADNNNYQDIKYHSKFKKIVRIIKSFARYGVTFDAAIEDDRASVQRLLIRGTKPMLELFMKCGYDSSFVEETGYTMLHAAVSYGNTEMTKELVKYIDVNSACQQCGYPLHIATHYGWISCVCLLLEAGADIDLVFKDVHTALNSALSSPYPSTAQVFRRLLLEKGNLGDSPNQIMNPGMYCIDLGKKKIKQRLLVEHILKMKAADICIGDPCLISKFLVFAKEPINIPKFLEKHEKEVEKMKKTIFLENFSAYDWLKGNPNNMAMLLDTEIQVFFDSKSFSIKFPLYADYLLATYIRAFRRRTLIDKASPKLQEIFSIIGLPHSFTTRVSEFLPDPSLETIGTSR